MNKTDYAQMKISRENFANLLVKYMEEKGVSERAIADLVGCSEHVIMRIKNGETYPSDEMLVCGSTLLIIGHEAYKKLSEKDKLDIYEKIGVVIGGSIGFSEIAVALMFVLGGTVGVLLMVPTAMVLGVTAGGIVRDTMRHRHKEIDGRWENIIITSEPDEDEAETPHCNGFTVYNFRNILAAFMEKNNLNVDTVAKSIGCSEISLARILAGKTWPTDETLKQGAILIAVGFDVYNKLKGAVKEKISEAMGSIGGGTLGFGTITAVISTLGIPGLSSVGITSGLAALGGIIGGGMMAGVLATACIPIAAGAAGYLVVKTVKKYFGHIKVDSEGFDPKWERPVEVLRERKSDDCMQITLCGDGSSQANAVSINARSAVIGIQEKYSYIESICGIKDVVWTPLTMHKLNRDGREYDLDIIEMQDGSTRAFWFDIKWREAQPAL